MSNKELIEFLHHYYYLHYQLCPEGRDDYEKRCQQGNGFLAAMLIVKEKLKSEDNLFRPTLGFVCRCVEPEWISLPTMYRCKSCLVTVKK